MSEYGLGTEALPGACGSPQSGRLQAWLPPLLLHRTRHWPPVRSGQAPDRAIGPAGHSVIQSRAADSVLRRIVLTEALARAGRPNQEDFKLGGPRCCCTVTVPGHGLVQDRAIGPPGEPFKLYSQQSRSLAGSDSVAEALARTGRPSQKDFKLGAPHCSGCCTEPDLHRTGPSGRLAIIQSTVAHDQTN